MKGVLLAVACFVAATVYAGQDSLSAAKDLYASAAYEDALAALARLRERPAAPEVSRQIDQYRAFCLVALGRTNEAESVAETLIKQDPLLQLDGETAPRIEAMFAGVRKRLLPGLIRAQYQSARTAIGQKDFAAADSQLKQVRRLLDEAQSVGASNEALDDLRLAVDGLLDLTGAASEIHVTAPPAQPPIPEAASLPSPVRSAASIYDSTNADVDPPVAIYQRAPSTSWPRELAAIVSSLRKPGSLAIVIGESGTVEEAVMVESIHPIYDRLLIAAAHNWKYKPALKSGVPVRYRKTIRIEVKEQPE